MLGPDLNSGSGSGSGSDRVSGSGPGSVWPVWLKRTGIRYWSVALEKFGAPALTCTVRHNAEPPEIDKALDAMAAIIGGASTVLREGEEIELLEAQRRAGGDYAAFTAALDAMIADAVLGQRATSEIGPWQATAEIHAEVLQRLVAADARRLQATLRHSLAAWLTHWNHPGAATPCLARDTAPAEDLERRGPAATPRSPPCPASGRHRPISSGPTAASGKRPARTRRTRPRHPCAGLSRTPATATSSPRPSTA